MNWMKERTLTLFVRLKTLCDVKHNKSYKTKKPLLSDRRNKMAAAVRTNAVVYKPTSGVTTDRRNS